MHLQGTMQLKTKALTPAMNLIIMRQWIQDAKSGALSKHTPSPSKRASRRRTPHSLNELSVGDLEETVTTRSSVDRDTRPNYFPSPHLPSAPSTEAELVDQDALLLGSAISAPVTPVLHDLDFDWLQTLYRQNFEVVFGSWMGRYSCPFL